MRIWKMPAKQHCNVEVLCAITVPLMLIASGCSSAPPPPKQSETKAAPAAKIVQFYAASPRIAKGEKTQLCYTVENASKVKLDPPVEQVWPAYSRCFEVHPTATTTYTLTAEDDAGHTAANKATVDVGGPPTTESAGRKGRLIQEVTVNKLRVAPGEPVVVCYTAKNATSVTITPGESARLAAQKGCVTDRPKRTTTYHVVAKNASGESDSEQVVVKVQ